MRLKDRETLTQQEADEREEEARASADLPPRAGDPGTYNAVWRDPGKGLTPNIAHRRSARWPCAAADARRAGAGGGTGGRGEAAARRIPWEDLPALDTLHHARRHQDRQLLQQQPPDHPGARLGGHPPGTDSRGAHRAARRTPAPVARHQAVDGRLPRPLGGRHAGRGDDQLHRHEPVQRFGRHECGSSERFAARRAAMRTTTQVSTVTASRGRHLRAISRGERVWRRPAKTTAAVGSSIEYAQCHDGERRKAPWGSIDGRAASCMRRPKTAARCGSSTNREFR